MGKLARAKDRRAILEATKQDIWTIWYAAEHGKTDRVRCLLEKGRVHVNVAEPHMQWTALHYAARHAHADVIQVLLEHHANPDAQDKNGNSPLHLCAGYGSFECAMLLLEGGADTLCPNHEKATALDMATAMDHADIRKLLQSWRPIELSMQEREAKAQRIAAFKTADDIALLAEPEMIFLERRALQSKEVTLGCEHPGIIATLTKLASLYRDHLREADAMTSLRRAVAISELHYGDDHLETAVLRNNLAELLYHVQQLAVPPKAAYIEEAVTLLHRALPVIRAKAGQSRRTHTNMDEVTCLENLCLCLQSSTQHALADACLHDLLAIYAATYGSNHEKVLRLQQAVAATYLAQKRFDEAYTLYTHVIEATSAKHGRQHPAVAHAIEGLGRGYFLQGAFEMAETAFNEVRSILLQQLDAGDEDRMRTSNNLAVVALAKKTRKSTEGRLF